LIPEGVKGVRASVKCQAPSGRRIAIRISSPGVCSIRTYWSHRQNKKEDILNFGPVEPKRESPNGAISAAGWSPCRTVP
jgi:hypothetical protein